MQGIEEERDKGMITRDLKRNHLRANHSSTNLWGSLILGYMSRILLALRRQTNDCMDWGTNKFGGLKKKVFKLSNHPLHIKCNPPTRIDAFIVEWALEQCLASQHPVFHSSLSQKKGEVENKTSIFPLQYPLYRWMVGEEPHLHK